MSKLHSVGSVRSEGTYQCRPRWGLSGFLPLQALRNYLLSLSICVVSLSGPVSAGMSPLFLFTSFLDARSESVAPRSVTDLLVAHYNRRQMCDLAISYNHERGLLAHFRGSVGA